MLEQFFLERIAMEGETIRIAVALAGTAVATWYDVKNNKNVPNNVLYAFLAIAFITNAVFFQQEVFVYGTAVAAAIFAFGYLFYRLGYIGGADVYVLSSIALLLPVFPSHARVLFNFPVVFSIIISSGVLFALYFLHFIFANIMLKGGKGRFEYFILLPAYAVLVYFFASTGIFGTGYLVAISALLLSSILFMVYKYSIVEAMAKKVRLSKVEEEDVSVPELMPALAEKYKIKRLLDAEELRRLKKLKVKEIYVYTGLPPFLPFVLVGLIISIILGDLLAYTIGI